MCTGDFGKESSTMGSGKGKDTRGKRIEGCCIFTNEDSMRKPTKHLKKVREGKGSIMEG
jgi:hypothetical protein